MTYAYPIWEYAASIQIAAPAEQSTPRYWKSWQVHNSLRIEHGFQNSLRVWLYSWTKY
jgi:hypothetical protein